MNAHYLQAKAWIARRRQALMRLTIVGYVASMAFGFMMGPASAAPIKPDCTLAKDLAPAVDKIASNIYGLAAYGKVILIVLTVLAIFLVFTKHLGRIGKAIGIILALGLLLVTIQSIWNITGAPNC